jgi:hypothetical protein
VDPSRPYQNQTPDERIHRALVRARAAGLTKDVGGQLLDDGGAARRGAALGRHTRQRDQGGCDVEVRGEHERHVVLLAVRDRALGVQLVCTVHVAVVGRQYDDGLVGEACSVELRQHSNDVVIRIAQATAGSY